MLASYSSRPLKITSSTALDGGPGYTIGYTKTIGHLSIHLLLLRNFHLALAPENLILDPSGQLRGKLDAANALSRNVKEDLNIGSDLLELRCQHSHPIFLPKKVSCTYFYGAVPALKISLPTWGISLPAPGHLTYGTGVLTATT